MVMLRLTDIFLLPYRGDREECYIRKKKSVKPDIQRKTTTRYKRIVDTNIETSIHWNN